MGGRVAVIGGGLGGLAAANVLAGRGHDVVLFEHNGWLGGKAAVLEAQGFRFDMGPTILTLPRVLERVVEDAGHRLDDELEMIRLDPQWRCFFDGGRVLDLVEDTEAMAASLEPSGPETAEGYRRFLALSARLHEISENFFFWRSVEDIKDTIDPFGSFNLETMKAVLALRMGQTLGGTIRKHVSDHQVAQMLDHMVQYVGSSPLNAPAVLCGIAHMQTSGGIWYPKGGIRAVASMLERLARTAGVEVRTGTGIRRIVSEGGRVVALETTTGEREAVDAVVSNMDAIRTYRELVGGEPARTFARRRSYEPACSGVVLYLGLDRAYDHLLHHCFVFSRDPEEEFEWIYKKGEPAPDPTCYLAAPARTDQSVAPAGGEALYVLVHAPHLRPHHDWRQMLPGYRRTILDKLKRTAGLEDIESRIRFESVLTPHDIHERYRVLDGAIYGLASHGRFFGAFKPGNRSRDLKGLYLAGGAAHPGPGMPMVLMSGWIAADALDQDLRAGAAAA
ncbi:MAG: phytoene desaturase family protein [Geminicoccaceae bacterium]|nr:phytoene desaturase family protein [Geminicoccaceae bacterium]